MRGRERVLGLEEAAVEIEVGDLGEVGELLGAAGAARLGEHSLDDPQALHLELDAVVGDEVQVLDGLELGGEVGAGADVVFAAVVQGPDKKERERE